MVLDEDIKPKTKQIFLTLPEAAPSSNPADSRQVWNRQSWLKKQIGSAFVHRMYFLNLNKRAAEHPLICRKTGFPKTSNCLLWSFFLKHLRTYFKTLIHPILTLNTSCVLEGCHHLPCIYLYLFMYWTIQVADKPNWCCSIFSQWRAPLPKVRVMTPLPGLSKIKSLLILRVSKKQDKQIS